MVELIDALSIKRAALGGCDWGTKVACVIAARGFGYIIQDTEAAVKPKFSGDRHHHLRYQYHFQTFRGFAGLFEKPDFVNVDIHSYRHRFCYEPGVHVFKKSKRSWIGKPIIALCESEDSVGQIPRADEDASHFSAHYEQQIPPGIRHISPKGPERMVAAFVDLMRRTA